MHTLEQLRSGALAGTKILRLTGAGLSAFPQEIFDLAETLEVLDISGNALDTLPDDLPRLQKLRVLFCYNNAFQDLPAVLGRCPSLSMLGFKANRIRTVPAEALSSHLRWLILTDNAIDKLPDEIGRCAPLQKLMLAGNRLEALPDTLAACTCLELLRISANRLSALPSWLTTLPRLAWPAIAGNPFMNEPDPSATDPSFAWDDLALETLLGEGASGHIYRARHRDGTLLAIKVFKGAMTSDGLPHNEMIACLAAGHHPNLIPILGRVTGHPEGRDALAMTLIDPAFVPLAGPPSLESCTRDVYDDGLRFDPDTVVRIATGIASAVCHLHARGLIHGDLYAHNILHAPGREPLLGDFGGAALYGEANTGLEQPTLECVEVRAFGCLLEELISRCDSPPWGVVELAAACLSDVPSQRPLFEEIVTRLRESEGRPI